MKEFKSAHSKMFSRRRNNANLETDDAAMQANQTQVNSSSDKQPPLSKRTTGAAIKAINTSKKVHNLLGTSQVHLAAAN